MDSSSTSQDVGLQVELLENSFAKVAPQADAFATSFYDNLFTDYPDAKPLFHSTDLKAQSKKLVASLVFVVENLKQPEALSEALKGLGARHVKYGALPEHYPLVGNSLIKTFQQYLKEDWTDEIQQAWVDAYGVITEVMLDGAEYDSQEVALETPAPEAESEEEGGLNVKLLTESFEKVKPQANEFAMAFYGNLFTDYPAAKPLFEGIDVDAQSKKLLASLVFVVENLKKPDALTDALKGLGARHVKYGALPEHYPLVGSSLLKTFEQFLKADWTPDTKQAWVDAYGVITEVMLDGADYDSQEVALETPAAAETAPEEEGGLKVDLLTESFEKVKPQANEFAMAFYNNLFTDYPAAKPLFEGIDVNAQSKKLLASLVFVVENLKKPDALTEALKGLGARHVKYGALPEHYPLVGSSLLKTFEQFLKADWTPDTKQAWVDAYGVITEVMLDGADYDSQEVALDAASSDAMTDSGDAEAPNPVPIVAGMAGVMGVLALILILL